MTSDQEWQAILGLLPSPPRVDSDELRWHVDTFMRLYLRDDEVDLNEVRARVIPELQHVIRRPSPLASQLIIESDHKGERSGYLVEVPDLDMDFVGCPMLPATRTRVRRGRPAVAKGNRCRPSRFLQVFASRLYSTGAIHAFGDIIRPARIFAALDVLIAPTSFEYCSPSDTRRLAVRSERVSRLK
jgi:hypothetical protein